MSRSSWKADEDPPRIRAYCSLTHFLLEGLRKFNGDLESAVIFADPIADRMVQEEKKTDRGQDLTMFSNVPRVGMRLCE